MAAVGGESARESPVSGWTTVRLAEVHWYEAHGIGRKEFKIKRYID